MHSDIFSMGVVAEGGGGIALGLPGLWDRISIDFQNILSLQKDVLFALNRQLFIVVYMCNFAAYTCLFFAA